MRQVRSEILLLGCAAAVVFSIGIGRYDLWPPDEPRFAQVAREMIERADYLVPHVNAEVYNEKPPLLFWAIAALSLPVGDVSEITARIPSVLSGVAVVLLTYLLGLRLYGRRTARWAAIVLLAGARFWWQARTGQIDMLLTAWMTLAFYALWRWDDARRAGWLVLVYGAMAAGALAKGPVAFVFPLLTIMAFYWRERVPRRRTHWILGTLAAVLLLLLWYVPARWAASGAETQAVQANIGGDVFRQIIGRLFLGVSKAQPPWYYLTTIPVDFMPWTLLFPWTLPWIWRNRGANRATFFLWCACVPALIFFSISIGKRNIYILPLFPIFALLTAAALEDLGERFMAARRSWAGVVWGALLALVGAAPFVARGTEYGSYIMLPALVFGGVLLAMGAVVIVLSLSARRPPIQALFAMSFVVLVAPLPHTVFPVINEFKSARTICAPVRELAEQGENFRLYSVGFSREEYIFYSHHPHQDVLTGLVGAPEGDLGQLVEIAKDQKEARSVITDAVEDVPVADIASLTQQERDTLRAAIERALDEQGEDMKRLRTFETALIAELDQFAAEFGGAEPAFLYVQAEDWRWLAPLFSSPFPCVVVRHESVGRRDVLLLANESGARLAAAE